MIFHHKKNSQEHTAAKELLALVRKEMATMPITRPAVEPSTVKSEPEKPRTLLSKPTKTSTVVACNKRGSVKALTEIVGRNGDSKKEKEVEEKVVISEKKVDGSLVGSEEKGVKKKRSKEIAVTGQRSSKTGNKSGEVKHEFGGNEISSHDATEVKTEKKENVVKKKQGAASFLKRIKQNSPSEVTTKKNDENEDDDSDDESKDEKEEDEKKGKGKKKEVVAKNVKVTRSSGGRGAREENGRGKRGGGRGRPPKRGAAVAESPVKRSRENGENEAGSRARKRSRR